MTEIIGLTVSGCGRCGGLSRGAKAQKKRLSKIWNQIYVYNITVPAKLGLNFVKMRRTEPESYKLYKV